jgi:hypothetical protein
LKEPSPKPAQESISPREPRILHLPPLWGFFVRMLIELMNSIRYALLKKQSFWIAMLYWDIPPDLSGKDDSA